VLSNPANRGRAVPLTYEQFRYAFANEVPEDEAKELYVTYSSLRPPVARTIAPVTTTPSPATPPLAPPNAGPAGLDRHALGHRLRPLK